MSKQLPEIAVLSNILPKKTKSRIWALARDFTVMSNLLKRCAKTSEGF